VSGLTRPATVPELAWIAGSAIRAQLVEDRAELLSISESEPWRVRVTEKGEAALLARWREQLDYCAVLGLWCSPRRVPLLVTDLLEVARAQGFGHLLGPLVPESACRPYLDAGLRIVERVVVMRLDLPTRIVGVEYPPDVVRGVLEQIGCTVLDDTLRDDVVTVVVPSWRADLTAPIDLVEEVARLRGYDEIPSVLPAAPSGRGLTPSQRARRSVARSLAESGLVEVLTYPFVSPAIHDIFGLSADDPRRDAARLVNPLSDEQPELRTSLLATLVEAARTNVGRGVGDLGLFEIGLVTRPVPGAGAAGRPGIERRPSDQELAQLRAAVPPQPRRVAGLLAGHSEPAGWWGPGRRADHTDAIAAVQRVASVLGVELTVAGDADHAPWHPGRCARLTLADGTLVGHAGELNPKVLAALDLPPRSAAFEVDLDVLLAAASTDPFQGAVLSTFPVAKEDIALVVDVGVPAADVFAAVRDGAGELIEELRLFDVFTGAQVGEGKKSLAFSLRLRAADRTLTAQDAIAVREAAVAEAGRRVGAVLRGV